MCDVISGARWKHSDPPTDRVKLRFAVADHGVPQIIEAGIDDFRISIYKCQPGDCCGAYADGKISLSDLTRLIDHVYISRLPWELCPQSDW